MVKQVDLYLIQSNKRIDQLGYEQNSGTLASSGRALHEIVQNRGPGFAIDTRPLFVDGKCFNKPSDDRVFLARDGKVKCGKNGEEEITTEGVDEAADAVDNSGSTNNDNASARHKEQKLPTKRLEKEGPEGGMMRSVWRVETGRNRLPIIEKRSADERRKTSQAGLTSVKTLTLSLPTTHHSSFSKY